MAITKKRETELLWSNRVLAFLVVVLALTTGYLWSERSGWFSQNQLNEERVYDTSAYRVFSGGSVTLPIANASQLSGVMASMRNNIPVRNFTEDPISLEQLSDAVFAAQGQIAPWGDRTSPSYKSAYPLQVSVLVLNNDQVDGGSYYYDPTNHSLLQLSDEEYELLSSDQPSLNSASIVLILSADLGAHQMFVGEQRPEIVWAEAGQAAENVLLMSQSLGFGGVVIHDFDQARIRKIAGIPENEIVMMLIPLGIPDDSQGKIETEELLTKDDNTVQ